MIDLARAVALYERAYPDRVILTALDVGDEWVFSAADRATGEELDLSPTAVSKADGSMRVFFPPMNLEKLKDAVPVDLKGQK